jgi:hypothetical protein
MAIPKRDWWFDVNNHRVMLGGYWSLAFRMDYDSFRFFFCCKWFGIYASYMDDIYWTLTGLESVVRLFWDQRVPLEEGCILFNRYKEIRHVHKENRFNQYIIGEDYGYDNAD